jgi:hypothetical protein
MLAPSVFRCPRAQMQRTRESIVIVMQQRKVIVNLKTIREMSHGSSVHHLL